MYMIAHDSITPAAVMEAYLLHRAHVNNNLRCNPGEDPSWETTYLCSAMLMGYSSWPPGPPRSSAGFSMGLLASAPPGTRPMERVRRGWVTCLEVKRGASPFRERKRGGMLSLNCSILWYLVAGELVVAEEKTRVKGSEFIGSSDVALMKSVP